MAKYRILKSPANEAILTYLGLRYEKTPNAIIFEGDMERDLWRIVSALIALGYAHNEAYAFNLARSFFINPV
jgi:hypothetical protein